MVLIGEGESGKVYLDYCETTVSKFFKKKSVYEHEKHILSILIEKNICNHAEIISYCDDQNMIKTKYITNKFNTTLQKLCNGEMNHREILPITIAQLIYKILLILDSLHKHEIIHGDFKDKNIMLGINCEPFVIDFDLCVVEFNDYEHLYELMCNDLHKMKLLIIQLLWNVDYKTSCTEYDDYMKKIETNTPHLYKLLSNKNYNLDKLVEYFMIKSE
jgi:serine/threonine protein kinase